jgi:transglutaminase superfamily protein
LRLARPLALSLPALALFFADAPRARCALPSAPLRWTDKTADAMVDDATNRALAPGAAEHTGVAAIATIAMLAARARSDGAKGALERISATPGAGVDLRGDAALLARTLAADEGTDAGSEADHALGVVDALAILGPFRDTGGGLDAHDGPEGPAAQFDRSERYSWGSYEVTWRTVPRAFATARGVPLDLFVFPRKESCTWVASRLSITNALALTLRVAATGQVRLVFDGADLARDESVNTAARLDRIAARINAGPGEHLLAAKVCSGALDDEGRVRLRVVDDSGHWPEGVQATSGPWERGRTMPKRPVVRPATTPLARAIGNAAVDVDARLDEAILRTLGGADDLRSPRAPGILAALADGGIDPDRLAMVAWIAPSGVNRGAWLNRARGSADPPTRAFIDRRLVERHLEAQLADWAMAALRGAHLESDGDGEARLLEAQVDLALGTEALRIRAMRRLDAWASASPKDSPDAVLDLVARLGEGLDARVALSAREQLATRGDYGADRVRVLAATKGRSDAVKAALRAFATGGVDDADEAIAVAQTIARCGSHGDAQALYQLLARWAPNRAAVWAGLAQEMSTTPGSDEVIGAALRRARELDPGEARYRAELALRTHAPTLNGESPDDEKYIVASQTILARRRGTAAAAVVLTDDPSAKAFPPPSKDSREVPDVADRELHWLRAVVMHPDRRVSEMVHYAREIVIPPRTEDELYEDIPAEGDLSEILRARVHRRDGTTAFPLEEANEDARPRIRWPDLAAGDVVEVAFRSWTAGPVGGRSDPPFYRLDYAGALSSHPVLYNEVVVESPRDRPIYVDVVNGKPDRREEREDGAKHVLRLVWDRPINVPDEPLAPPLSEVIPTVVLSTFKDWNAFRSWYGEAVHGFTEPDAQVRELAASLTKGKTGRDEKLRALFEFVADHIRYVNYVSGEWWLPNRPQQLLARREGDCDDKALLLITLLKAVGIDAQEVMVQTRLTGEPSILRAPGAAIPLFDHGIAFLPGPNGGTYLDATSPQSRLGPLPSMDARAVALRMDGPAEIVGLPASSPEDHGIDATWMVKLSPDGSAELDGEEHAAGDDAFWMRTYLTEPGARAQWVEDRLAYAWFSTVEVDKKVDFRGDLPRGGATLRWRARSDSLARHEGPELVVPLSPSQTTASQLAPLVRRTLPVWLPPHLAPRKETRMIRVVAPKGWTFEALPSGGDENGGTFGRAHFDVVRDPSDARAIIAKRTVVFDQSAISVEEYPKWRAWVQRVDALMHKAVRLIPTGGAR